MQTISDLLDIFIDDSFNLDGDDSGEIIKKIVNFYKDGYRHQYHEISRYVSDKIEWEKDELEFALENIKHLIIHLKSFSDKYEALIKEVDINHSSKTIIRILEKLYDHFALEEERLIKNNEIIEESKEGIRNDVMEQFEEIGDQFKKRTEEVSNSLNNNIVTVVGLFSAIIFVFFGGITGMSSVIKGIFQLKTKNDLILPVLVLLLIGFVIFNTIFLLLYSIAKIVDKNIGLVITLSESFFYIEESENGCFKVLDDEDETLKCFKNESDAYKFLKRVRRVSKFKNLISGMLKRCFLRYPFVVVINGFFMISIIYLYYKL